MTTAQRHFRNRWIAAQATLDEIAHRVVGQLFFGDLAFAQQQFDMTVVARALDQLALTDVIDAAVANVRPIRSAFLDGEGRDRRARPRVDALPTAKPRDFVMRATQR